MEPEPLITVHVPFNALPPILPETGTEAGSHTGKSGPAFTVAIGFTVTKMSSTGPAQPLANGVIVYVTVPTAALVVVRS